MPWYQYYVCLIVGLFILSSLGTPLPHQTTVVACPSHKAVDPFLFMQALWNITDSPIQSYEYIPQELLPLPIQAPNIQYGLPQFFIVQTAWPKKVHNPRPFARDAWFETYRRNYVFCAVVHIPVETPQDMGKLLQPPTHHVPTEYISGSPSMKVSMFQVGVLGLLCCTMRRFR